MAMKYLSIEDVKKPTQRPVSIYILNDLVACESECFFRYLMCRFIKVLLFQRIG